MEAVDPDGWLPIIQELGPSAFVLLVLVALLAPTLLRMWADRRRPADPPALDLTDLRKSIEDIRKRLLALERRAAERDKGKD
jgi:hypothetical protein